MARPVSSKMGAARWSDMSCLHWKTALPSRGLPPGLMGFVSLWIADGTGGFESVPAPSGALSLFRALFPKMNFLVEGEPEVRGPQPVVEVAQPPASLLQASGSQSPLRNRNGCRGKHGNEAKVKKNRRAGRHACQGWEMMLCFTRQACLRWAAAAWDLCR